MAKHNWTAERRIELTASIDARTPADELEEQFGMPIKKIIKEAERIGGELEYLGPLCPKAARESKPKVSLEVKREVLTLETDLVIKVRSVRVEMA